MMKKNFNNQEEFDAYLTKMLEKNQKKKTFELIIHYTDYGRFASSQWDAINKVARLHGFKVVNEFPYFEAVKLVMEKF